MNTKNEESRKNEEDAVIKRRKLQVEANWKKRKKEDLLCILHFSPHGEYDAEAS
ncbi:hypothetical protein KI387_036566, partial [Taxus chinensis]